MRQDGLSEGGDASCQQAGRPRIYPALPGSTPQRVSLCCKSR